MRWDEERYVRIYTRDTPSLLGMGWEARALFWEILRKADRAGAISLGKAGARGLAALTRFPLDVVERALPELIDDGCVEQSGTTLIVPNYIEAQEASMSPAHRQKESRERRRDLIRSGLDPDQRSTVIYFIQSEHGGHVKIGRADDLAKRLQGLATGRPDKLVLLGAVPGTLADERRVHAAFAAHRDKGEWFLPHDQVMAAARAAVSGATVDDVLRHAQAATCHETSAVTPIRAVPIRTDPLLRAPARVESTPEGSRPSEPNQPLELTLSETFAAEEAKPVGELDVLARVLAAEGNPFGQRCVWYLDGGQALPSAMRDKLREILAERAKPRPSGHRRVSVTAEEQALVAVYVAALKQIRREEVPQLELHALAARRILPDLVTLAKSIARDDFFPTPADVLAHKLETYLRLNDQRLAAEGYPLGLVLARTDASDLPRPPKRARPAAQGDGPRAAEEPRPTIRYAGRGYDDEQAKSATGS